MSNQAAWLDGKDHKLRVGSIDMPKPSSHEIVVKNYALAVNPIDWKIQDSGMYVKKFPIVLGCDITGEVSAVGDAVTRFKKGDRVTAHSISLVTSEPADGGFQHYTKVPAAKAAILPQNISFNSGSVLPLAFDTAVVGLSVKGNLELPMPSLKPKSSGKTIVVWGGSSSVGALATQLAVVGGVKVIATASSHNFDFCKTCGATEVFDYKSSSVVDDLVKAVESAGGEFAGVYDTISLPASYEHTVPVIEKLGGGKLVCVLPGPKDAPSNVQTCQVFGVNDDTHQLWEHYITPALENGSLKCMPEPLVIGTGLEAIQQGFDKNKAGVSAKEVVIELKH